MRDVVTITTPIAPPSQDHQGRLLAAVVNRGGNDPEKTDSSNKIAVPDPNEISEACKGWATFWPRKPLTLGCVPSKHPAANPTTTAITIRPGEDKLRLEAIWWATTYLAQERWTPNFAIRRNRMTRAMPFRVSEARPIRGLCARFDSLR